MAPTRPPANPSLDSPRELVRLVAGIDTHKHTHHVAILDRLGRDVADREFVTTSSGYAQIIEFFRAHGLVDEVGVEGTGSYGAGIARVLRAEGFTVVEVTPPKRQARRLQGKSDPIDARHAALAVLSGRNIVVPKSGDGAVESLRILLAERRSAVKAKSQTMNQIHALLVTAPEHVRNAYRATTNAKQLIDTLTRTRPGVGGTTPEQIARQSLKRLACRHRALGTDVTAIDDQLEQIVRAVNPTLLSLRGVGPVTAATLLVAAGDNPDRLTTRAAFAALAGVAPIPASSGQRTRHRLSRGGNRQANAALHRIMLLRIRHQEPRTTAYVQRRRAEGLTNRDIARCLKRHIANEIYKALLNPTADQPGHHLRSIRQQAGVPVSALARTLGVQHQRLRRLETGIRADPELEQRALATLAQITTKSAA